MTSFFPSRTTTATLPTYPSEASLPLAAVAGDVASVLLDNSIWQYTLGGWVCIASGQMLSASGTGVLKGGTCTIDGGGASYSISNGFGVYIDYSVTPHTHKIVYWSGLSNIPVNNTRPNTYIAIDKNGALFESGTELTSSDERDYFYLAGYTQVAGTILGIKSAPVLAIAPANQLNDLFRSVGVFKVSGLNFSGIAATLSLSRSSGVLFDRSNNWKNSEKNPHEITISAQSPLQFKRVTQTTINQTNFTTLDVGNYDNAGTVTAIAGSNNQATNMRLYQFGTGTVYVQYGQQVYTTLANAVAGIASENFNTNPVASQNNAVLVCTISVIKGATDLTNTSQAIFHLAGRFGDQGGGASGGVASITLQQAYDNSGSPEIQTDSTRGALQVRRGATAATGDVLTIEDQSGNRVAGITDTGALKIGVATGVLHSDASGNITSSQIFDGDVATGAAITGTKISPDFGSQNVTTTGTITASGSSLNGFAVNVQNVNATDMYGSLDAATVGGTLSIGTGNASAINIGTGPGATTINLGGTGDTVLIAGTLTAVNTTNLEVSDKLITLNKGGAASSGGGSGFEIEENGSATGYVKVNTGRTGYQLKPPSTGLVEIVAAAADTTLTATSTVSRSLSLPDVSGTLVSTGDTGTVTSTMILDGTIVDADINASASIALSKLATGALPTAITVTSANIVDGTIVNADVNASAAIDGSKIVAASGSVPGVVTTGTQTIAGNKTLDGVTIVSNSTASTSSNTGALVVAGGVGVVGRLNVGGRVVIDDSTAASSTSPTTGALVVTGGIGTSGTITAAGGWLELGQGRGSDGPAFIDLKSVSAAADFNARLIRNSGTNGTLQLLQTGSGSIDIDVTAAGGTGGINLISAGGASVLINRAGTNHIAVDGNGTAVRGRTASVGDGYIGQEVFAFYPVDAAVGVVFGTHADGAGIMDLDLPVGIWAVTWRLSVRRTTAPDTIAAFAGGLALNTAVTLQGAIRAGSYDGNRVGGSGLTMGISGDLSGTVFMTVVTAGTIQLRGSIVCGPNGSTIIGTGGITGTYIIARRIA